VVTMLASSGGMAEVRAIADGVTHAGYFDDYKALVRSLHPLPRVRLPGMAGSGALFG